MESKCNLAFETDVAVSREEGEVYGIRECKPPSNLALDLCSKFNGTLIPKTKFCIILNEANSYQEGKQTCNSVNIAQIYDLESFGEIMDINPFIEEIDTMFSKGKIINYTNIIN